MRRSSADICADILSVAVNGAKKTHIVYKANLNFRIVKGYISTLVSGGLLTPEEDERYYSTEKGVEFLKRYRALLAPMQAVPYA
ncbi:transcriptional regulator [Candidatus Bathyarchaeota archaeon]|nr:transcriptional regulator [Candidatus Bathyarchaeota archaeon]MBL7169349.1 transcriptional regulator [Candidatus Bathyarchaeota archaeon]